LTIRNPSQLPAIGELAHIEEPIALVAVHTPEDYVGAVFKLCEDRRGVQTGFEYVSTKRVQITYEVPYAEVIFDFFDKLKSSTRGYASMSYDLHRWETSDLVRLDVLLNGDRVDALSVIVHESRSYRRGQSLARKLKEHIPRQMYDVAIQAAIGHKVIARTTVKALRKDVTSKCYGGDISRKRKLLERQKAGKKRMKAIGAVEVPQSAFLSVLGLDD
jgi:GTP-binding protein LepA